MTHMWNVVGVQIVTDFSATWQVPAHSFFDFKSPPIHIVIHQAVMFRLMWGRANEISDEKDLFPGRFENTFFTCALLFEVSRNSKALPLQPWTGLEGG
jgi:hypothetical protein